MLTCAIIAVTTASSLLIPGVAAASTPQLTARTVSAGATVKTDHGTVVGINAAQGRKFLGIPYAAKPGRWQDPQPRAPWKTLATKTQHAPCPQPPFAITDDTTQYVNEDCLFLNVYTPPGPISDLPVMFFIPGGGAANGNAAPYDGSTLARKGHMIVVTANTRVGALGFLALPALGPDAGNYGVKDTVAALRWVRHNIRAFGGDTTRVTYAGFSSSTLIGCDLLASPKAAGLFSRIIQISAPCGFGAVALTKATTNGNDFAADAGCATATNVLACLRKLPVSTILAAQTQRFSARAVSGTPFLPVAPLDAIASGKFNKVPVLITGALDETRIFLQIILNSLASGASEQQTTDTLSELVPNADVQAPLDLITSKIVAMPQPSRSRLLSRYSTNADAVLTELTKRTRQLAAPVAIGALSDYAPESADIRVLIGKASSDYIFACPERGDTVNLAKSVPTYQGEFADRDLPSFYDVKFDFPHGAYHTVEQGLLWNLHFGAGPFTLTAAQQRERDNVVGYVSNFVARANPNGAHRPVWQTFNAKGGDLWIDDAKTFMRHDYSAGHDCSLYTQLPAPWEFV